jgi:hypothetical protein
MSTVDSPSLRAWPLTGRKSSITPPTHRHHFAPLIDTESHFRRVEPGHRTASDDGTEARGLSGDKQDSRRHAHPMLGDPLGSGTHHSVHLDQQPLHGPNTVRNTNTVLFQNAVRVEYGAAVNVPAPWQCATRSARPRLSADLIVRTALDVLAREGIGAVSMRRVAQELETGAASLYAHVARKSELHDLVYDRALADTLAASEMFTAETARDRFAFGPDMMLRGLARKR